MRITYRVVSIWSALCKDAATGRRSFQEVVRGEAGLGSPAMAAETSTVNQKYQQGKPPKDNNTFPSYHAPLSILIQTTSQEELKRSQKQLVAQLQQELQASLGPPLHTCLGGAFVALYSVGDTFSLHETLGKCCDIIKTKEDAAGGPSNNKLYVISDFRKKFAIFKVCFLIQSSY